MKKKSDIVKLMREEYRNHLQNVLNEISLTDSAGNVVVAPGLKVLHIGSKIEYVVDRVSKDPASGDVVVIMRKPTEVRPQIEDPSKLHPDFADKGHSAGQEFTGTEEMGESESGSKTPGGMKQNGKKRGADVGSEARPPQVSNPADLQTGNMIKVSGKDFEENYKEA